MIIALGPQWSMLEVYGDELSLSFKQRIGCIIFFLCLPASHTPTFIFTHIHELDSPPPHYIDIYYLYFQNLLQIEMYKFWAFPVMLCTSNVPSSQKDFSDWELLSINSIMEESSLQPKDSSDHSYWRLRGFFMLPLLNNVIWVMQYFNMSGSAYMLAS